MSRRSQKLASCQRTSEAVSSVAQTKITSVAKMVAPVSGTADTQGVTTILGVIENVTSESGVADLDTCDDMKGNSDVMSEEQGTDGIDISPSEPQSQTDANVASSTNVASSCVDSLSSEGTSLEDNSTEKIERLRKMIDHAAGQMYTIAEVYLMMMKPSRVALEYDWVNTSSSDVATDDMSVRLQKLVSMAKAAFALSTAKPVVSINSDYN